MGGNVRCSLGLGLGLAWSCFFFGAVFGGLVLCVELRGLCSSFLLLIDESVCMIP